MQYDFKWAINIFEVYCGIGVLHSEEPARYSRNIAYRSIIGELVCQQLDMSMILCKFWGHVTISLDRRVTSSKYG